MMDLYSSGNGVVWIPFFFFFNDTATTEIYTLSLHDALPIYALENSLEEVASRKGSICRFEHVLPDLSNHMRSEEHTSELQSRLHLVCRLLLEKKKHKTSFSRLRVYGMTHPPPCGAPTPPTTP